MNEAMLIEIVWGELKEILSIPESEMSKDLDLSKYLGEKKKMEKMSLVIQSIENKLNSKIDALNLYQNVDLILDVFLDSFGTPSTLVNKLKSVLFTEPEYIFQQYFGFDAIFKFWEFWSKWVLGIFGVKPMESNLLGKISDFSDFYSKFFKLFSK